MTNQINKLSTESIIQSIMIQLNDEIYTSGEPVTIEYLNCSNLVTDETIKFKISDHKEHIFAVVLCSPQISPGLVARGADKAAQACGVLDLKLGQVVIKPLMRGEINGISYAVLPYYKPISEHKLRGFLQKRYLRPSVFKWLRQITITTKTEPSTDEIHSDFLIPLQQIASNQMLSRQIQVSASLAIERILSKQWHPQYVLAHNDFWEGNLLLNPNQQKYKFMIIDWPGANNKGHAIYDLIHMAISLRLSSRLLLKELHQHCCILDCSISDATGYLLTSLGFLGMNLEHFPMERYIDLIENSYNFLSKIEN